MQEISGPSYRSNIQRWKVCLPKKWINTTDPTEECQRLSKTENLPIDSRCLPVHICLSLVVYMDGRWFVNACGHQLTPSNCELLESVPSSLTPSDLPSVVEAHDSSITCSGNNDAIYCELAKSQKGVFKDSTSKVVRAKLYTTLFLYAHASYCNSMVHTVECDILVTRKKEICSHCKAYRPVLRSLSKKRNKRSPSVIDMSSKTNWHYLSTPEKKERY